MVETTATRHGTQGQGKKARVGDLEKLLKPSVQPKGIRFFSVQDAARFLILGEGMRKK